MQSRSDPEISVIIPNWNGAAFLREVLACLGAGNSAARLEILVVDNGSSDGSADLVRSLSPRARVIENTVNAGFARAVNQGLHTAAGRYVAVINNDTAWSDDWLDGCRRFLDAEPAYDFAAPLVLRYGERGIVDSAGDGVNLRLMPFKRGCGQPADKPRRAGRQPITAASCSAVLFRREFFDQYGAFDEDFFMYYEDVDLFFRAFLGGGRGCLLPEWTVFHHEGGSVGRYDAEILKNRDYRSKHFMLVRNRVYFLVKNCPGSYFWLAGPLLALELARSLAYHLGRGRLILFLRAHREALRGLRTMWRKRRIVQKNRVIPFRQVVAALRG